MFGGLAVAVGLILVAVVTTMRARHNYGQIPLPAVRMAIPAPPPAMPVLSIASSPVPSDALGHLEHVCRDAGFMSPVHF